MILRTVTITQHKNFQSRWISNEVASRYEFWDSSGSWASMDFFTRSWTLGLPNNEGRIQWADSVSQFFKDILDCSRLTDDVPFSADDPKRLAIGFIFPKTNLLFQIRLSTIKATSNEQEMTAIRERHDFHKFIAEERRNSQR